MKTKVNSIKDETELRIYAMYLEMHNIELLGVKDGMTYIIRFLMIALIASVSFNIWEIVK